MNKKDITLEDIAKKLNISKSAVSLALAGKYGVGEKTRGNVLLEAANMGYRFEKNNIINPKRNRVAILLSHHEIVPDSFFAEILLGIEKELQKNNIIMDIRILNGDTDVSSLMLYLKEHYVNGVITFSDVKADLIKKLRGLGMAVVLIDNRHYHGSEADQVKANNYIGGYNGAEFLYNCGHKNVCFIGDIHYSISFAERYYGCREFAENHNMQVKYIIEPGDTDYPPIYNRKSVTTLLSDSSMRPTALFCANDPIALEVYRMCMPYNIRIPEDISVLSFDNTVACERVTPELSSINIPRLFMGSTAVNLLIDRLKNIDAETRTIQVNTTVVDRHSVRKILPG